MRHFSYYLFENFDADADAHNPFNPRRFLNADTDAMLSYIAGFPAGSCDFDSCVNAFGTDVMNTLIVGGILKRERNSVLFDTPIFLREDAAALRAKMDTTAGELTDELEKHIPQIRSLCASIRNGFSVERNLYHILSGMIFDGFFFDYLEQSNAVATSRPHLSGFDYLSVIYECCPELNTYSDGLLCSYNRFANAHCALQSFGDANGNRYDFYRFFRLLEAGKLPPKYDSVQRLFNNCGNINKDEFLQDVSNYIMYGSCCASVIEILEQFGYAKNGAISVPVYTVTDKEIVDKIEKTVEACLGELFASELAALSQQVDITANHHGVASAEIANELYHILFGSINEELVRRGIVAEPPYIPGEGRYLKCIQLG